MTREVRIEGVVIIDPPVDLDGAHVDVQLRDSGMADAASVIVARAIQRCSGVAVGSIDFLVDASVEPGRAYTLAAEVRRGDALAREDLLSVVSHAWRDGDPNPVEIEVKPVQ